MIEFTYVITSPLGIHARPAGLLCKTACRYSSDIKIGTPEKMVDAKRIMGVMGLALRQGHELTVLVDGADEEQAARELEVLLQQNL